MTANFSSKRNPFYTSLVDDEGNVIGTADNPLVTEGGGGEGATDVNVLSEPVPSTLFDGSMALTTTAVAIGTGPCSSVMVTNSGSVDIIIGNATSQSFPLKPGAVVIFPIDNISKIFAKVGTGTGSVAYQAVL